MFWGIVSSVLSVFNTFAYQQSILTGIALGSNSLFRTFYNNAVAVVLIVVISLISIPFSSFARIDFSPYVSDGVLL